jgi:hypothetical protein
MWGDFSASHSYGWACIVDHKHDRTTGLHLIVRNSFVIVDLFLTENQFGSVSWDLISLGDHHADLSHGSRRLELLLLNLAFHVFDIDGPLFL